MYLCGSSTKQKHVSSKQNFSCQYCTSVRIIHNYRCSLSTLHINTRQLHKTNARPFNLWLNKRFKNFQCKCVNANDLFSAYSVSFWSRTALQTFCACSTLSTLNSTWTRIANSSLLARTSFLTNFTFLTRSTRSTSSSS